MPQDKIDLLYKDLQGEYDLGSIDDFKSYLSDNKKRELFFNEIVKPRYDVTDIGVFEDTYGLKKKEPATTSFVQGVSDKLGLKPSTPFVQSDGQGLPSKTAGTTTPSVSTKSALEGIKGTSTPPTGVTKIKTTALPSESNPYKDQLQKKIEILNQKFGTDYDVEGALAEVDAPDIGTAEAAGRGFLSGVNNIFAAALYTPEYLRRIFTNPIMELAGMSEEDKQLFYGAQANNPYDPLFVTNKLSEYYKGDAEKITKPLKGQFDKDFLQQYEEGDYIGAAKQFGVDLAQSIPATIGIAAATAAGVPQAALMPVGSLVFASQNYQDIDPNSPMSETAKQTNSFLKGFAEQLFENLGTSKLTKQAMALIEREGVDNARAILAKQYSSAAREALKPYFPLTAPLQEGLTEGGTAMAQNVIDMLTDPSKKNINIMDNVVKSTIMGTGMGVAFGGAPTVINTALSLSGKKKAKEIGDKIAEIDKDLDNEKLNDQVKGLLVEERAKSLVDINNVLEAENDKFNELPEEVKTQVQDIQQEISAIDDALSSEITETAKQSLEAKNNELTTGLDNLIKAGATTTDGEGTIEEPISAGTDVLETGVGMAAEPGKEGVEGEGVQTEAVPQAPVTAKDIEKRRQEELNKIPLVPQAFDNSGKKQPIMVQREKEAEALTKEINAKYDAELAALDKEQAPEVEKPNIILSGLSEGFKGVTRDSFDIRSDNDVMEEIRKQKSFAKIITKNGKKYIVVGLYRKPTDNRSRAGGRDDYSFAMVEYNSTTPSDIVTILEGEAKNNFKNIYRDFNDTDVINPITKKDSEISTLEKQQVPEVVSEKVTEVTAPVIEVTPTAGSVVGGEVEMNDVDAKRMKELEGMIKPEMYYSDDGKKQLVEINEEIKAIESKYGKYDLILEHGTPHDFDKFQLDKIGTGEGHQAFGHGLYFTENSKIAKTYAEKLSKDKEGLVYQVRIKDGKLNDWLEWRDALDDTQAEKISKVVASKKAEYDKYLSETKNDETHTGAAEQLFNDNLSVDERPLQAGAVYSDLRDAFGSQEATRIMQEAGVDGVKYKTKGGKGNDFNYVVFNPESIVIENKQALKETPQAGSVGVGDVGKNGKWNNTGTEFTGNKFSKDGKVFSIKAGWNKFNKDLLIKVLDENGKEVSVAPFKQDTDGKFHSEGTGTIDGSFTNKDFRGKGIMKSVYDFVDKNYGEVKPSKNLTNDGLGFWESNRKQSLKETPTAETKPTEAVKVEPAKEATKPTKTERKVIAEAKIDDLAAKAKEFLRNKNLPEGTKVSGVSQDKVIDILASTVKALVNSGIEIAEAIKQVREYFEQDFDTSGIKDYEISQAIARDELTDVAKDNGFSSYREAVFAVNKYVRAVGKEDVITKEEIEKAKEAKDKEAEAPKKGYKSKKKQAQEGEKETTVKETGRSKSYAEGRVPVSEAYNDVVNAQKEYYETMNRKEELANAEGYLASFGNTEEGLLDAYIDMMEVFKTNPYLDPKNSIAIEILADRMFAMAIDFRDKGQTDKYNNFLEKSEKLRKEAFQAHFRAGQYTSAVAVFSRSANPDAFLIFVEGQQAQEFEKAKKSKPEKIKEYEAAVNDFYEKAKEIKKDAARQAVVSAPNSTTKVNVKLSDKLKARYEQGKARQAEALKKLGKINFFGSSGLSNEAIEAVGELVLSQFEQGIYKAATIIERIIEITEGKLTEKNIKDVYDAYKVNYKGEKLTLTELEEVLRKEEIAEKELATDIDKALEKEREKLAKIKADYEQAVVDKADALVLKRAQQFVKDQEKKVKEQEDKAKKAATAKTAEGKRPTLSDLIQRELEADSTKEQIAKELVEKGGLSEREANKLAEIYYNKYRKILKEKITSQLLKDLTPKKVKQIEAQMNALKDKPYGKTLGGMIANQVAAGALDSEILRAAFAEKYGLPSISPVQADIIRDLARKARAAKTQLGLQTANKNLLEYVNSFVKPKYGSLLGTLYYMGLLTGVSTAAVNTFGNVNGLINQSTENFVQSVIEAIQGNKGNLMSSSKPAQKILMAIANMNDSLSAAIDILIHGGGESRYSNIKKDAFGEITTEDLIVKRKDFKDLGFKKLFTTLFKLYKTPPALFIRNLPASDEGFTMANFNMEATRELRKKLYAEGYRGADLEKKVYEQVYGTTEIKAKALQEAIKELKRIGIDPANRKILANRIAKEIIANSLDEKVQNVANEVAKENTFRGKPRGMAGYLSRKIPQTWLISPFVTTPSRILEKHMNYIPLYGILRYYGYGFSNNLRKAFPGLEKDFVRKGVESSKREGELRNKQLAQVLATHALLLVFWGLSQIDWEDEKGNIVPFVDASAGYMGTDIEERKRLEELMPAYMIRIGNFKFSYKTNPLLAMIALPLGVIKDAERSFEAADYSKSAFAYNFELFNFLYESNPIEGYQDFFEGLSKSFRTIKEEMTLESIAALPVKMAADFSSNVAVDNFYKQIVDFTDPLVHEAQDLMEVIYKAFNMEKIGDLTPTHDRWGRPVKRYPGESFFPLQHLFNNNDDKKITEWEIKNGIEIPTINRKTLVLTNNTLKTEKSIKNQREELVKDYGLTSDEVKYFDEALNSDFNLLTKDEWNKMSETIRYDVFTIIKNNFENATEEYKKLYKESINSEERNIKPISKLSRPDAKKLVEILFKIKKREYINNNFTKIE